MATIEAEVNEYLAKLDQAIAAAMQGDVLEEGKRAIANAAYSTVYPYEPIFYSRREVEGGIADPDNMDGDYDFITRTLEITDNAPWQHLWGGHYPTEQLAEAIEKGWSRFVMRRPGPRPFNAQAEQDLDSTGAFDRALQTGINRYGF